jgi:NTE family protein
MATDTPEPAPASEPAPGGAPRVVLVLGGGGMKGMAHLGAYKALEEAGIRPACIVGCSIGALVGALFASGRRWNEIVPLALGLGRDDVLAVNRRALLPLGLRAQSVWVGERLQALIRRTIPARTFAELDPPLVVVAVDYQKGAPVYFGTGALRDVPLHDALYASAALPVLFPPARIHGRVYVDGGVADPLPIEAAAEFGADLVIAVDVGSAGEDFEGLGPEHGLVAIHQRAAAIATAHLTIRTLRAWRGPPLVYVRPNVAGYSGFEFGATRELIEEGYRAARRALAHAPEVRRVLGAQSRPEPPGP